MAKKYIAMVIIAIITIITNVVPVYAGTVEQVLAQQNKIRATAGLSTLVLDEALCQVAEKRAAEAAVAWSHSTPEGERGIDKYLPNTKWRGENLAYSSGDITACVDEWEASPTHQRNMMFPLFTKCGLGFYSIKSGGAIYTFCACVYME